MLDHIEIKVRDVEASRAFYDAALAPLGMSVLMGGAGFAGYGDTRPFFWIGQAGVSPDITSHVAFGCETRALVEAFYKAAIAAGGRDNGAPGLRPQYHPSYYGAFVLDPDGHNIEAVCHAPA
ncbi:MAG TPA: VOC family protein [Caulobacteraceae bacterium]|jgi:catechol 2,3-dioxygenase-like lactoylglutathione lyase family enzyme